MTINNNQNYSRWTIGQYIGSIVSIIKFSIKIEFSLTSFERILYVIHKKWTSESSCLVSAILPSLYHISVLSNVIFKFYNHFLCKKTKPVYLDFSIVSIFFIELKMVSLSHLHLSLLTLVKTHVRSGTFSIELDSALEDVILY